MHQRWAVQSDHSIERDPVLPQSVHDLVGIDAPRSVRICSLDAQEAVGPFHGYNTVFRQEVDVIALRECAAQCAGESARVDGQFLCQKRAAEMIHTKR